MLLNVPELPTNDDQLPTRGDRKASFYQLASTNGRSKIGIEILDSADYVKFMLEI